MQRNSYLTEAFKECSNNDITTAIAISKELLPLWKNWNIIVGEPMISYIYPIGTKADVLIVGTHDSSSFQEIYYYKELILESVNSALQNPYFTELHVQYNTEATSLVLEANRDIQSYSASSYSPFPLPQLSTESIIPPTSLLSNAYQAFYSFVVSHQS